MGPSHHARSVRNAASSILIEGEGGEGRGEAEEESGRGDDSRGMDVRLRAIPIRVYHVACAALPRHKQRFSRLAFRSRVAAVGEPPD